VPGDERVRLFVALELPLQVRDALVSWRSQAAGGAGGLRLIAPEDLHVTLCFLGWREASETAAIEEACAQTVADHTPPSELELGPAVWLPPRRPRVLAVELIDDGGTVAGLQSALSSVLEQGGWYVPEKRPFRPHVTVARVGRGGRAPRDELAAPPGPGFAAAGVTLFRSRLSPGGARYEALARFG
jgi:2'-5' RNA ligase